MYLTRFHEKSSASTRMMLGRRASGADFPCAVNPAATASDAVRARRAKMRMSGIRRAELPMDSKDLAISLEELQLAARNHGMPLEALRYSITPVGLHYLLIHYDIPPAEEDGWTVEVGGAVERPATLTLQALKAAPGEELTVTMECAGNGRVALDPRPVSQPWLLEAVGTARWRGTPLRRLLEEAGPAEDAVEVLFTGADQGREGGIDQQFQRSLSLEDALGGDAVLAY